MEVWASWTPVERARAAAIVVLVVGVLFYAYSAYDVLQAGGFTVTSRLQACAEAATGRASTTYRLNEELTLGHGFFPPTATCRWSGGSSAVLVPPTWTWTGLVMIGAALAALPVLRLARRRPDAR